MGTSTTCTKASAWAASTAYSIGDRVTNDTPTRLYTCTGAGTSAGSGGPTGTGTGISDNTVTWDFEVAVDYTSMSSWESNEQTTLSGATTLDLYKSGNADTSVCAVNGWTAGGSNADYINIQCAVAERHDTTRDTGYYMDVSGNYGLWMFQNLPYRVNGLAVTQTTNDGAFRVESSGNVQIENCLAYDTGSTGFYNRGVAGNIVINCIAYGTSGRSFFCNSGDDWDAINCTNLNGSSTGFDRMTANCRNNVGMGCSSDEVIRENGSSDYWFTEDGTGTTGANSQSNLEFLEEGETPTKDYVAFKDKTAGSENADIVDLGHGTHDNVALSGGADVSSATMKWTTENSGTDPRTVDCLGRSRTTASPTVGAVEFAVSSTDIEVPSKALSVAGKVPTAKIQVDVTVGADSQSVTGQVPTVSRGIPVGNATRSVTGFAPTVERNISVTNASLSASGQAPTLERNIPLAAPTALSVTGQAPTVQVVNAIVVPSTSLAATGYSITLGRTIPVGKDDQTITAYAPTVTIGVNQFIEVVKTDVGITAYAPSISISASLVGTIQEQQMLSFLALTTQRDPDIYNEIVMQAAHEYANAGGVYNERLHILLNTLLAASWDALPSAQNDMAAQKGATNWSSTGDISPV